MRKVRAMSQYMRMVLEDLASSCTAGFHDRWKSSMKLNYFSSFVFYCYDIPRGLYVSVTRQELSVRRPYARHLSTMKNIWRHG